MPPSGLADGFFDVTGNSNNRRWATVDLDGDRKPDLVQTGDAAQANAVWGWAANPYWKVYRNTGSGFTTTAFAWTVPVSGLSAGFSVANAQAGTSDWSMADMNGDGRLDVVQTSDPGNPSPNPFTVTTAPSWHVFLGIP